MLRPLLGALSALLCGCSTASGLPEHTLGAWGGAHVAIHFQGGLADVQFDCGSGTIDNPLYPARDGSFAVKGTYVTGTRGPIKVGEYFRSQEANYSGQVEKGTGKAPETMTLFVALEDGTKLGPFALTQGAEPQFTPCLREPASSG
jgi:hypothetical protein